VGGFLRGDSMAGAVMEESPLLKKKLTVMGGIAVSWVFMESEARVDRVR
jgi:hypothetical protein